METYALHVSEDSPELIDGAPLLADRVQLLRYIPLRVVRTGSDRASQFAAIPGVLSVRRIGVDQIKVIEGIDTLIAAGKAAYETSQPNGWIEDESLLPRGDTPLYPYLDMSADPPRVDMIEPVFLPTRLGFMSALNLSLGTLASVPFRPDDPVNVATEVASRVVPVVVAAGNWGPLEGRETLSAWAEAPWVISVGATHSPEGGKLLPDSSIGSRDNPQSGPTVVAYGSSTLPPHPKGTSFAAPKVSRILAFMSAFCLTLRHFVQIYRRREYVEGIPLVGFGGIDRSIDPEIMRRPLPLPALPRAGVDTKALAHVVSVLDDRNSQIDIWPTPEVLRRMLIASAQPVPGHERHEVGNGFVGWKTTRTYLETFSGADFVTLFCTDLDPENGLAEKLSRYHLADHSTLVYLLDVWEKSLRKWAFDMERYTPSILAP